VILTKEEITSQTYDTASTATDDVAPNFFLFLTDKWEEELRLLFLLFAFPQGSSPQNMA